MNWNYNKKLSYRKEIVPQHSCHNYFGGTGGGIGGPRNIFLSSSLITMQNLVVVCHDVCAHVYKRSQEFRGTLGQRPWGWERDWPPTINTLCSPRVIKSRRIWSLQVKPHGRR